MSAFFNTDIQGFIARTCRQENLRGTFLVVPPMRVFAVSETEESDGNKGGSCQTERKYTVEKDRSSDRKQALRLSTSRGDTNQSRCEPLQ